MSQFYLYNLSNLKYITCFVRKVVFSGGKIKLYTRKILKHTNITNKRYVSKIWEGERVPPGKHVPLSLDTYIQSFFFRMLRMFNHSKGLLWNNTFQLLIACSNTYISFFLLQLWITWNETVIINRKKNQFLVPNFKLIQA